MDMKMKNLVLLLVLLSIPVEFVFGSDLFALLPKAEGWQQSEDPAVYSKVNLFEYIDGNCELYFSYGFVRLINAYYSRTSDPQREVTVDIYDMGKPLNAFGVYSSMTHPDYNYAAIGSEAIISPQQIRFWQGSYEIEIRSNFDENNQEILTTFARAIAQNIPESPGLQVFDWLPVQTRVPHSLKYVAKGFLGQDFLPGGIEALYTLNGEDAKGFVVDCGNANQARQYLKRLQAAQAVFEGADMKPFEAHFESYHKYSGYVWAGRFDSWLYGAISQLNPQNARLLANEILKILRSLPSQ